VRVVRLLHGQVKQYLRLDRKDTSQQRLEYQNLGDRGILHRSTRCHLPPFTGAASFSAAAWG
jgi:hypothetical protein